MESGICSLHSLRIGTQSIAQTVEEAKHRANRHDINLGMLDVYKAMLVLP